MTFFQYKIDNRLLRSREIIEYKTIDVTSIYCIHILHRRTYATQSQYHKSEENTISHSI